jgi:hypothetical protein
LFNAFLLLVNRVVLARALPMSAAPGDVGGRARLRNVLLFISAAVGTVILFVGAVLPMARPRSERSPGRELAATGIWIVLSLVPPLLTRKKRD